MQSSLAKNSLILMLRMIIVMGITLYSSRILLKNLGVTNFGIYNIVASTILLFSFIQSSLSGASSRFLTYELESNNDNYAKILNGSLSIHLFIAIILFVLGEVIGTYIVNFVLSIPPELKITANIAFQFSLFSTIIVLICIPYESVLISHEKFSSYAYISLLDVTLKLISALLLILIVNTNERIFYYSLFLFFSTLIVRMLQRYLALKLIVQYYFYFVKDKNFLKPIFNFFSWDLFGNLSLVLKDQGVYVLQNVFFGAIINAASAISTQVLSAIGALSNNILIAVKPKIIKNFANGAFTEMNLLINRFSKFSFYLMLFISVPIFFNIDFILKIWLVNVPNYTNIFCRLNIIVGLTNVVFLTINHAIHATGKIKLLSIVSGGLYMLIFPVTYLFYYLGYPPETYYMVVIIFSLIAVGSNVSILKTVLPQFNLKQFLITVIRILLIAGISFIAANYLYELNVSTNIFINIGLLSILAFFIIILMIFIIDGDTRLYIAQLVNRKLKNKVND